MAKCEFDSLITPVATYDCGVKFGVDQIKCIQFGKYQTECIQIALGLFISGPTLVTD